jgi:GNAT superfamily N-acetyltransferase
VREIPVTVVRAAARIGRVHPDFAIRALGDEDWELVRDLRRRALTEAPEAFASSWERERRFDEAEWRYRTRSSTWFTAEGPDGAAGVVCVSSLFTDDPGDRHLMGMWVDRAVRGRGIARALVLAVVDWAAADGASAVTLWVVDDNLTALGLYRGLGFTPTGRTMALPSDPTRPESQLTLAIAPVVARAGQGD